MNLATLELVNADQIKFLLASGRYKENVVFDTKLLSFAIIFYDLEEKCYSHALSYTQRADEGRERGLKLYKSWPARDLKTLGLMKDRGDIVLYGEMNNGA